MVAKLQINRTKVLDPLELVKKVVNSGNLVLVPICDFFQRLVINVESLCLIFISHNYNQAF